MIGFSFTDEQSALIETARKFVRDSVIPVAAEADRASHFPKEVYEAAWKLGLVAPGIPSAFGGAELSALDHALLTEELAYGCTGIQTSITATTLAATPIIVGGSDAQKKKYLGMLTDAPVYASYATTEPGAGSDVAGMQTRATKHGDDWVLTGQKCFITNASLASFYVIFAQTEPGARHKGIAAFIVDRDSPGLSVGKKEDKMGQRASDTATVILEDVRVPAANLLAAPGQGFKLAMATFDRTRPDIGAGASGLMRRCLDECVKYAQERQTFGTAIANHQAVQFLIAEMAIKYEATRLLVHKAAWLLDERERGGVAQNTALVSACSKAFGADSAMQTATDAVQVFGGNGYMREYPVEKLMRDAKVLQIYEGTSQIQRVVIARNVLSATR